MDFLFDLNEEKTSFLPKSWKAGRAGQDFNVLGWVQKVVHIDDVVLELLELKEMIASNKQSMVLRLFTVVDLLFQNGFGSDLLHFRDINHSRTLY